MAGKLPNFLCPSECVGQLDFVGLDYYWGINNFRITSIQKLINAAVGRFGDAPVWPQVFYYILKFHSRLFPDKEIDPQLQRIPTKAATTYQEIIKNRGV